MSYAIGQTVDFEGNEWVVVGTQCTYYQIEQYGYRMWVHGCVLNIPRVKGR
jgi:hypothetical protein